MLRQGFGTCAQTTLQATRRPSGEPCHKTMGRWRQISVVSDPETILVERKAMTAIIRQTPGRHRRKNIYKNSRAGWLLLACAGGLPKGNEVLKAINKQLIAKSRNV